MTADGGGLGQVAVTGWFDGEGGAVREGGGGGLTEGGDDGIAGPVIKKSPLAGEDAAGPAVHADQVVILAEIGVGQAEGGGGQSGPFYGGDGGQRIGRHDRVHAPDEVYSSRIQRDFGGSVLDVTDLSAAKSDGAGAAAVEQHALSGVDDFVISIREKIISDDGAGGGAIVKKLPAAPVGVQQDDRVIKLVEPGPALKNCPQGGMLANRVPKIRAKIKSCRSQIPVHGDGGSGIRNNIQHQTGPRAFDDLKKMQAERARNPRGRTLAHG